jgi:hypothetical protein
MLLLCSLPGGLQAQRIRGRVVDEATRQAIAAVTVSLITASGDTVRRAGTGADGFYILDAPQAGAYRVVAQRIGYAAGQADVIASAGEVTVPALVLLSQVVPLDSVKVTAEAGGRSDVVGFGRASQVVSGERLARLERQATKVQSVIRELPGIRMRTISRYTDPRTGVRTLNYLCIESPRRVMSINEVGCNAVVLVIDDIAVGDPYLGTRSLSLSEVESIEFMPPAEAGMRYGLDASAVGAIVIWTRGRGPYRSPARAVK